jgi:NitT/TauT family transport system substrate-binding protein
MTSLRPQPWSRRKFLGSVTGAATAGLVGLPPERVAAEPPPETTTLRLDRFPSICLAPQFVADGLLRTEGFTDVQYVSGTGLGDYASGKLHFGMEYSPPVIVAVDAGEPLLMLGGIHVGCLELFGTACVQSIRDLKGKRVAVRNLTGGHYLFISAMAAHVGIDPKKDIDWVVLPPTEAKQQLADGTVDAYLGFPPDPQELRAKNVGHVIVNGNVDRPWSQYFCCMLVANREFARQHPVATKRALRALLKATDLCASDPERVADLLVAKGYTTQRDYALRALKAIPYNRWRQYNAEDTVRFYALRLHETGMIKSTPQKIIAQGTDWRFFNELKKELKG